MVSFVDFQANAQPQSIELIHDPIPLFDIALKGIESGCRQYFCSLPADLSQHRILCDTYDFLRVNVLGGQSINEISRDLKSGQSDYNREKRREIKGDKLKARDIAFKPLYLILLRDFKDKIQDSAKVFNAVLYLVSYAATFK